MSKTLASSQNGGRRSLISFNPRQPQDYSAIELVDGDSLFVPRASNMVTVMGAVVSPGLVPFQQGKTVDYYLNRAGGLGYDADRDRMVVVNPITGGEMTAHEAGELFDGEILFVPVKESKTGL
jgi:protein involved in polysaccharide export with SLBB domain